MSNEVNWATKKNPPSFHDTGYINRDPYVMVY